MNKPTPVFLVGLQRSGTRWLAHVLCAHSNIAGVRGPRGGIAESFFFSHVARRFGDLGRDDDFIEFLEAYACSTYFISTGLSKDIFYRERPTTYCGFFRLMMDEVARKKGADLWLEKSPSHSFCVDELSRCCPDAKFIGIKRDIVDNIRSALKLRHNSSRGRMRQFDRLLYMLHRIVRYHAAHKHIARFQRKCRNRMILVDFESLRRSTEVVVRQICDFLGIDFEETMLQTEFSPNTSFGSEEERQAVLTPGEERLIRLISAVCRTVPYAVYHLEVVIENALRKKTLPRNFYAITKKEKGLW